MLADQVHFSARIPFDSNLTAFDLDKSGRNWISLETSAPGVVCGPGRSWICVDLQGHIAGGDSEGGRALESRPGHHFSQPLTEPVA